jgi:predicted XRE-type DNA-binding protein
MPNKKKTSLIEYEENAGNVFAALGLDDADELFTRAQIGFHVYTLLKQRKLKPRAIASLFSLTPPDVSHLMNGHYSLFTADKLLDFLRRLDQKVTIHIRPHRLGEPYQEVSFAA